MGFLSLVAKLGLDISGYETGLKRAQSQTSKLSGSINSALKAQVAGAIAVGAITAAGKAVIDYASHINDVSTRVGIGTEKLQEYAYAAKQTGSSLDDFANVARKLAQSRAEAMKDPAGAAADGFAKLGVSASNLKSLKIEGIIDKIGVAFQNAKNPQELLAAGFATMGRGALPVIGAMREGLAGFGEDARAAGLIIKDETIAQLDDMGDSIDRLKGSLIAATAEGLGKFVKGLTEVWRLVKSTTAGVAAYYGALAGGASDSEAKTAGYNARVGEVEKDVASDMAFDRVKKNRKQIAGEIGSDFSESSTSKTRARDGGGLRSTQLNNLQQIGAYSGVDPVVKELQASHTTQKKIEQNTKKAVSKSMAEPPSFG